MDGDAPVTAITRLTQQLDALEQRIGIVQRWEDRLGSAVKAAWHWRVFAGVMLCVNLSLSWWAWQPRPEIAPYVFVLDHDGRVFMEGIPGGYTVTEVMVLNRLEEWVKDARTRDNDRVVLQRQWTRAKLMTAEKSEARQAFNDYMDAEVPSLDTQTRAELTTLFKGQRTRGRYRLEWREKKIGPSGRVVQESIWEGEFDVLLQPPKTIYEAQETVRYGILITHFSWGERVAPGGA